MRNAILALVSAALLGVAPAAAAEQFNVTGVGPTGGTYSGKVELIELKDAGKIEGEAFKVIWTIGSDKVEGVGLVDKENRNALSIAFIYQGALGAAVMISDGKDGATGLWFLQGREGVAVETWSAP